MITQVIQRVIAMPNATAGSSTTSDQMMEQSSSELSKQEQTAIENEAEAKNLRAEDKRRIQDMDNNSSRNPATLETPAEKCLPEQENKVKVESETGTVSVVETSVHNLSNDSVTSTSVDSPSPELKEGLEGLKRNKRRKDEHERSLKPVDQTVPKGLFSNDLPLVSNNRGGSILHRAKAEKSRSLLNSSCNQHIPGSSSKDTQPWWKKVWCRSPRKTSFRSNPDAERVPEDKKMKIEVNKIVNDVYNNHDNGTAEHTFFSSYPKIKTLEDSLNHIGMSTLLEELEESLEGVKRNKKTKEKHRQYFRTADKKMLKLSSTFHPDRVTNTGGSDLQVATAQQVQSALNASRTVLNILTKVFLDNIDIDYKYEFFSKLEISSLVNESEINHRISGVLYKINVLSEIKRMNIIGEIRKFLVESQECIRCYLLKKEGDFQKHRDYALYHLKKCIEGYKKFETECKSLEEECIDENEEDMRLIMQNVSKRSSKELSILISLKRVARSSLRGNFQIFTVDEPMDEYFILPFVYHANALLMCNVMLEKKKGEDSTRSKFSFLFGNPNFPRYPNVNPYLEKFPVSFAGAYHLASHFKDKSQYEREVERIVRRTDSTTCNEDVRKAFDEKMQEIISFLETEFMVDAYSEGKSNKERLYEKFSRLTEEMIGVQEKVSNLGENINICKRENQEFWNEYRELKKNNEEMKNSMQESFESSKKGSGFEFFLNRQQNRTENRNRSENQRQENRNKEYQIAEGGDQEMEENFSKSYEQNKNTWEQFSELLLQSKKNVTEKGSMFEYEDPENWSKSDHISEEDDQEFKERVRKNLEELKNIREQLSKLPLHHEQNIIENIFENDDRENSEKGNLVMTWDDKEFQDTIRKSSENLANIREQLSKFPLQNKQVITENGNLFESEGLENSGQNYYAVKDDKEFKERIQKSSERYKKINEQLSELLLNCKQNITEHRSMLFPNENHENWNDCRQVVIKDSEEMEKKIQETLEVNEKIIEQLSKLFSYKQNVAENARKDQKIEKKF